ncbi:MAG: metal-sensitive transcriptional regulator [Acidimicrobiales bacterium]
MQFPDDVSTDVHRRLRRIEGQIRGIQRLIDEGAECGDVVTQLSACRAALDRVGYKLIAAGMRQCATDPDGEIDADQLEALFLKLS